MTGVWDKRENAWVLIVPLELAERSGATIGAPFEFEPLPAGSNPVPSIEELCAAITPENRHGEIDWGSPRGREVW